MYKLDSPGQPGSQDSGVLGSSCGRMKPILPGQLNMETAPLDCSVSTLIYKYWHW